MSDRDPDTGHFLPGNRFWEARSSHGRNPLFADPEALWEACCEYFDWNIANPLYEDNLVTFQGSATHEPLARMRAMTIGGLCMFLDIDESTWRGWKKERADFFGIITRAEGVIYRQKFEGASASLLNPNIIARDLGLADTRKMTGPDGGPIQIEDRTTTSLLEEAKRLGIDPTALGLT